MSKTSASSIHTSRSKSKTASTTSILSKSDKTASTSSSLQSVKSSSPTSKVYDDGLPRSVRYAPAELRPEIRRRQNNESSRRFRERRATHIQSMRRMYEENRSRIDDLERVVSQLSEEITATRPSETVMNASIMSDGFYGAPF